MSVTLKAPSNIAIIKYWGKSDASQNWPCNSSLSMTLKNCFTETTVEFAEQSRFILNDRDIDLADPRHHKIQRHLQRLNQAFQIKQPLLINSRNSFPTGAGIASSASGMAALTLAFFALVQPSEASSLMKQGVEQNLQISDLARRGSGSACRSLAGGFVEWQRGDSPETQVVQAIADAAHWPLFDSIVLVCQDEKLVSSTLGHQEAASSPLFPLRLSAIPERLQQLKQAIRDKVIWTFGAILEAEASEMHAVMLSQRHPIQYFSAHSIYWIEKVRQYRRETQIPVFWTLDAGANVHIIGELQRQQDLNNYLKSCQNHVEILSDECGPGPSVQIA